jgi:Domain of unknown function (DUF4287)/Domain of unknown function (DUF5655)
MSFQAYLDNIKAKTGKTPEDFIALAHKKGLVKPGEIIAWLKSDFDLGHGHAMAIVHVISSAGAPKVTKEDGLAAHFKGDKTKWRKPFDTLLAKIQKFGNDVEVGPNKTYINLLRDGRKFAILQPSTERFDIGIKLKGVKPAGRLEEGSEWNSMVTHRVRISDPKQIDSEVLGWLKQAYTAALVSRKAPTH